MNRAGTTTVPRSGGILGSGEGVLIAGLAVLAALTELVNKAGDLVRPAEDDDAWVFVGYHGTSSIDGASLVGTGSVSAVGTEGRTYANGQLGPGFYTTSSSDAAAQFADTRVDKVGGQPVVLKVFARGIARTPAVPVPRERWFNINLASPEMIPPSLSAPISGIPSVSQRKFNPIAYQDLKVTN